MLKSTDKGRITVFALQECPHCKRSKKYLETRHVPYVEISLTTHPDKRNDMLSLADRLTVPQFFFNEQHIGGADDLIAFVDDIEKKGTPFQNYYEKEILGRKFSTDERLQVPTTPPVQIEPPPPRPNEKSIVLPDGTTKMSVLEMTEKLRDILTPNDLRFNLTIYKNAFTGIKAVKAFMDHFGIEDAQKAVEFGNSLMKEHKLLRHVADDHHKFLNEGMYYRLQCHAQPSVLNSFRIWNERIDPDAMSLLKRLKKLLGNIESAVTNEDDGSVDYASAYKIKNYPIFEDAVCELQGVDIGAMDRNTRLAFGINLYNLMIKYAFMKVGIGSSSASSRNTFFSNVQINVGGDILSFNLEHGVLRGNAKPAYSLSAQFSRNDKRARLAIDNPDCRIHFALNCGARSCPPVKNFTADAIDEELRIVAQSFAEQDDQVQISDGKLHLTKILSWFRSDFAPSNKELPNKVVTFLRGKKKEKLQQMIDDSKSIPIVFNEYDWGTNASNFVPYDNSILTVNSKSLSNIVK